MPVSYTHLLHLNQRKCVSLATDDIHDDIEYQLIKLSKEYEDNIYTIGNFHTGCFLNIEDKNHIHPSSVFIMEDTLTDYEFTLPEGLYLNLYYQGPRDPDYQHLDVYKRQILGCSATIGLFVVSGS